MRNKTTLKVLLFCFIVIAPVSTISTAKTRDITTNFMMMKQSDPLIYDVPIIIHGDEEIAAHASSGTGTPEDPYIIENKNILTLSNVLDYYETVLLGIRTVWFAPGISIQNTSASIIIRNVTCVGANETREFPFFFENNENISLEDVTGIGGFYTVFIRGNTDDPANLIRNGTYTIDDFYFKSWTGEQEGGITCMSIENVTLRDGVVRNTRELGLVKGTSIIDVMNFKMKRVSFIRCGFASGGNAFVSGYDMDTSNTVNGKPILFYANRESFSIGRKDNPGQIFLYDCHDFVIRGITIHGGSFPIKLTYCTNGVIENNVIRNSTYDGIFVSYSGEILIRNNEIFFNVRGGILTGGFYPWDESKRIIIKDNVMHDNGRNVRLILASHVDVINNYIYWSPWAVKIIREINPFAILYGIQCMSSSDVVIDGNIIENANIGFESSEFYGTGYGENFVITNNVIDNSIYDDGIGLDIIGNMSSFTISNNVIFGFENAMYSSLSYSTVSENVFDGHALTIGGTGSVYHGNLFNLDTQVFVYNVDTVNQWSVNDLGNYWSDYEEKNPSATNDGIVWDTPYEISWIQYLEYDDYPLVNPDPALQSMLLLMEIKQEVNEIETVVLSDLYGGRQVACTVLIDLARSLIHDASVGWIEGYMNVNDVNNMARKALAISMVARNAQVMASCQYIIETASDLACVL